ncbi:MAG: hypothetical protein PVG39_18495 [Desulfobacteraceae bacterium]|jgi:hypothetical protein
MLSSLCFPDSSKSCFACCPPIRPAGYDHFDYKKIIKRILLENSSEYNPQDRNIRPVTGFSCWAMGFIDAKYRQPGCLLHPCQNNGDDLRYRIDYGTKCMREACHEAKVFERLNEDQKSFWLRLTEGMDSFEYSSRKNNILFNILGWGDKVLAVLADKEAGNFSGKSHFLKSYPFFDSDISPKGYACLLTYIVSEAGPQILKGPGFKKSFMLFSKKLVAETGKRFDRGAGPVYVHKMDIDPLFADFLRISLQIKKSEYSTIEKIMQYTDDQLKLFCGSL